MYRIKTVLKVEMDIIISTEARPIGQAAILYNYSLLLRSLQVFMELWIAPAIQLIVVMRLR